MRNTLLMTLCSATILAAAGQALAQPVNDLCANATTVTVGTGQAFSIAQGTLDGTVTGCVVGNNDVWFRYIPTMSSGQAQITLQGSNFTSGIAVFTACGGTQIACNNSATNPGVYVGFQPGETFIIRVTRRSGTTATNGVLNITETAPPANDNCETATPINALGDYPWTNVGAGTQYTTSCYASTFDVFFNFTAPADAVYDFLNSGSTVNTVVSTYSTCGGPALECQYSRVTHFLQAGESLRVRLSSVATSNRSTTGTLTITAATPPVNDNCENAIPLTLGVHEWSTAGATKQYPGCADSVDDLFYSFVAPADASYEFTSANTTYAPVLTIYNECGGSPTECGTVGSGTLGGSRVTRFMETGETIIFRLGINASHNRSSTGLLTVLSDIQPAYDTCGGALNVSLGSTEFNTTGCYLDSDDGCGGFRDAFFVFTPPANGRYRVDTCGTLFDTLLSASFTCSGTLIAFSDNIPNTPGCPTGVSRFDADLVGGVPLYIRVSGWGQGQNRGYGKLNIEQTSTYSPVTNDACGTAAPITTGSTVQIPSLNVANAAGSASCSTLGTPRDVWFTYTPNFNGYAKADTCQGTEADTFLSVSTTCGGSEIVCNNDTCANNSQIIFPVTSGTTYRIRVGQGRFTALSSTALRVVEIPPPPANETCNLAVALDNEEVIPFDVTYAATELPLDSNWVLSADVWYSYTVPANGQLYFREDRPQGSTLSSAGVEVFDACGGTSIFRQRLAYPSDATCCVTAGQQLKIRVGLWSQSLAYPGTPGTGVLTFRFTPTVPFIAAPAGSVDENEDCAARVALNNYLDVTNGGYNNGVWYFGTLTCGVPMTATHPLATSPAADLDYFSVPLSQTSEILVIGSAESAVNLSIADKSDIEGTSVTLLSTSTCVQSFSTVTTSGTNNVLKLLPVDRFATGGCGANENYWLQYFVLNNGAATISTQPTNKNAQIGGSATFTVAGTGSNLKYQWRRGTALLTNGGNISGATSASLTVSNVSNADLGTYSVIVSSGCGAVISNNVTLAIGNACPADFNGDNTRDVSDLFAYINAWLAKTPNADFNSSGSVDVADLFAYINAWLAGC